MQRNFDNNINNLSDIYNTINNTNLIVATLPTKTDVSTSIATNNLNYSTTALVNTALTNAINLNNTSNVSYTNSTVNTAIATCNTFSTAYANSKISSEITANNLLYTPTASIGIGSQFNSVSIGTNTKLFNGFSSVYGFNATSSSYSIAIGYNAGSLSNINNASCCFI